MMEPELVREAVGEVRVRFPLAKMVELVARDPLLRVLEVI